MRDGYVKIVGRRKDMVIRGGENIYPVEMENFISIVIRRFEMCKSFGIPDKKYGEVLAAWIIPKEADSLTEEEVRQFCSEHIAHYKVPTYYRFVTEYPMTITGKN